MKQIGSDHKIFRSDEYQKDKDKFYLINQNLKSDTVLLYSDEENYVICRGAIGWPTWIWTKDNFDITKLNEIMEAIELYLTDDDKDKFTCKKELYDLLVEAEFDKMNLDDYFEMGTLSCKKTKKPRQCDGKISIPSISEKEILVKYWFDDSQEMKGVNPISMEQAERDVQKMLDSNKFYIWKNGNGKIVCMANYSELEGQAKISHVYTPIDERGKGYAANLIYHMTNHLLERNLVPLLYTDYHYLPSNKAYINVGYDDTGILINFSCSKEKNKPFRK